MEFTFRYNPLRDRDFLIASNLIALAPGQGAGDIWREAHLLSTALATYCSEKRIHPAMVCAWSGAREPSECYAEAAMLASMTLLETLKGSEEMS